MIALLLVLLAAQTVDLSATLSAHLPHLVVIGAPYDVDTDHNPDTDEVLIHAKYLFPPAADEVPGGPYGYQVFAFRDRAVCAGPVFAWAPTADVEARVSARRLSVNRDGVWTRVRLDTPVCR